MFYYNTLSTSVTTSVITAAKLSAGPLSWDIRSDGLGKDLKAVATECIVNNDDKSAALFRPVTSILKILTVSV
jgi:hypothetical protein